MNREQDAMAFEVNQARQLAAHMKAVMGRLEGYTVISALIEDSVAALEVEADRIEAANSLPIGPKMMRELGDYISGGKP